MSGELKRLDVVIGVVTNDKHLFLVSKRQAHQSMPGVWEFPGGKIESGESALEALHREMKEEVGIEVLEATRLISTDYQTDSFHIFLQSFIVTAFDKEAKGCEGQLVTWVDYDTLQALEMPPGNAVIMPLLSG